MAPALDSAALPPPTRPRRARWIVIALVAVGVVVGLRLLSTVGPTPQPIGIGTQNLVVVGVEGKTHLDPIDRAVIDATGAQVGAMSIRPRHMGECSASGWATLGAGRRTTVGGLCDIRTTDLGVVYDWRARQAAAAADRGDARLGTLSELATSDGGDCIASVGPGAALAAANPDGTNTAYLPVDAYIEGGYASQCPITLVDAGSRSDEVIAGLAALPDTTVIVTGIGPVAGSHDAALQAVYRLGADNPGWLTAPSTRRPGIITLADLTRGIIDFAHRDTVPIVDAPIDGTPLEVLPAQVDATSLAHQLRSVAALSDVAVSMYIEMGVVGLFVAAGLALTLWRRRFGWAVWVMTVGTVWTATMMLVGFTRWWQTGAALLVLSLAFWPILIGLTVAAQLLARRGVTVAVAAAGLTAVAFTAEALTGGMAEPGSMLNSRPIFSGRWYGFGNVTFSAYAAPILVLAGTLGAALPERPGRRVPGLWRSVAVLAIGFAMVLCEGWPTMGSDFGGVIAFTPIVLWLALMVSGLRPRWWAYPVIGAGAVLAVTGVAVLDWSRPPAARSHLGRFVQRVVDGDAIDVVIRKGVAMVDTVISPMGIIAIIVGIPLWWAIYRFALPRVRFLDGRAGSTTESKIVRWTAHAALGTAILGTLLNDGGISVWLTMTGCFTVLMALGLIQWLRDGGPERASAGHD